MKNMFKNMGIVVLALSMVSLTGLPGLVLADGPVTAQIVRPADGSTFFVDEDIEFAAAASGGVGRYDYLWNFGDTGDDNTAFGPSPIKSYEDEDAGTYVVTLVVTDRDGRRAPTQRITLNIVEETTPVTAQIVRPTEGQHFDINERIEFTAAASGGVGRYDYLWNFGDTGDDNTAFGPSPIKSYSTSGSKTITLAVNDRDGTRAPTVTRHIFIDPVVVPTPTVDLKVNNSNGPITITAGTSANLTWTSTNVTACTATGAWTGIRPVSGSQTTNILNVGTYTYNLSCTGAGQVVTDSVTITVETGSTSTPSVDLQASVSGRTVNLSWSSSQVNACTATGDWTGVRPVTGSEAINNVAVGTHTYNLSCTGQGQVVTDSVTVNVTEAPVSTPTVDLRASVSGRSVNLTWTSANVNACTATGAWTGIRSTAGNETLTNVAVGTHTYNLSCTGQGQVVTDSVTVNVTAGTTTLVISNIRVTDITQTTAIVRWDTNLPANSRVIYDTVSHPDISGASEPNFGYAHSSATLNEDPLVTEHAVPLTGLTPNTQYFFRVLSR